MNIFNVHVHIFTHHAVPVNFLPLGLTKILQIRWLARGVSALLRMTAWFLDKDKLKRYARYVEAGNFGSESRVMENLMRFYPEDTVFAVLAMDMAYMGAGKIKQEYQKQLDELASLSRRYPQKVLPFCCVDPRRPGIVDQAIQLVTTGGFAGIKLYPALGYFPYDEQLYPLYSFAQKNQVPITVHASRGVVYYQGKNLASLLVKSRVPVPAALYKKKEDIGQIFSHPLQWRLLLAEFPKLKINFAHFGGEKDWHQKIFRPQPTPFDSWDQNWLDQILDLMREYPNVYADISYTLYKQEFQSLLKVLLQDQQLRTKILFGSDYYMVFFDAQEKAFSLDLRAYLGEELYFQIAHENPKLFLEKRV